MNKRAAVNGFTAWIDTMPGKNNAIAVVGKVEVPTSGWTGSLTEIIPVGINPTILMLKAELIKPEGMVNE